MAVNYGPGSATFKLKATVTGDAATGSLVNVSAASFKSGGLASEMIVAAFGERLATSTATAARLSGQLLGTTVKVMDSLGTQRSA